jgi:biopolymer transport protein ExbD
MAATPQADAEGDEMISGINVTPLVDITLVLLIIFMVTTSYIVRQSMDVNLPRAAHGGENVGTTLMLVVHPDGSVYVDGAAMDDAALRAYVRQVKDKEPEAKAIIAADKQARYDSVIHVIDLVKGEGVTKFALNIEKEESVTVQ